MPNKKETRQGRYRRKPAGRKYLDGSYYHTHIAMSGMVSWTEKCLVFWVSAHELGRR